jgi:hypothetical protein
MSSLSDSLNVIPGMGRFKAFKKYGFDYAISSSNINFEPHSKLQISLGYGRQMIGNGYRSILLSDAAMNYPMVSARYSGKWFTYISSIALLQEQQRLPLGSTSESLFKRKLGSWNYLVITPHPNLEIGAMESVAYSTWNSKGRQAPHYSVYIPIIGARSLFSSNEKCVTMYGLNAKWNAFHQFTLYAQYALMINSSKSTGVQAGVLFNNFLTQNLDVRIEFNTTSPYMYSTTLDLLSYTQQQQTLGHPSGGDMNEWLVRVDYEKKAILVACRYSSNQSNDCLKFRSLSTAIFYRTKRKQISAPMATSIGIPHQSKGSLVRLGWLYKQGRCPKFFFKPTPFLL